MRLDQEFVFIPLQDGGFVRKHINNLSPEEKEFVKTTDKLSFKNLDDQKLAKIAFNKLYNINPKEE